MPTQPTQASTPTPTPQQAATPPTGDIFDQVANSMGLQGDSSGFSGATSPTTPSPAQQPQQQAATFSTGDIFDQVAAQHDGSFQAPASGHIIQPGTIVTFNGHSGIAKAINPKTGKMIVDWGSAPRWNPFSTPQDRTSEVTPTDLGTTPNPVGSAIAGAGTSLVKTAQGAAKIVHAPQSVQNTLSQDQQQLTAAKNANPISGGTGSLAEDVLEFISGDAAAKAGTEALSAADLMGSASKIAKAINKFPRLAQALQTAIRLGAVSSVQTTLKTGGNVGQGIEGGLATGALGLGGAGIAELTDATNPYSIPALYRKIYPAELPVSIEENPQPIYDLLHKGLRDAVGKAAEEEGVTIQPSDSIRDVVTNAANAVKAKASGLYQQIDNALEQASGSPSRYQQIDENISKLQEKIADAIGDKPLQEQLTNALQEEIANKQAALYQIKAAGLPDNLPDQATATFKRSKALDDLRKVVQNSTTGIRPDVAKGTDAVIEGTPERLNPVQFSKGLNRLYDNTKYGGRRLVQAVGNGAQDLLLHADAAKNGLERIGDRAEEATEQAAKIAAQRARVRTIAGTAATIAGLGALGREGSKLISAVKGLVP